MIIGIISVSGFIVCLVIIGVACYMRKRSKVMNTSETRELPHETESNLPIERHKTENNNSSMIGFKGDKKEIY